MLSFFSLFVFVDREIKMDTQQKKVDNSTRAIYVSNRGLWLSNSISTRSTSPEIPEGTKRNIGDIEHV